MLSEKMAPSDPPSPKESSGISDEEVDVVAPLSPNKMNGADEQIDDLGAALGVDLDSPLPTPLPSPPMLPDEPSQQDRENMPEEKIAATAAQNPQVIDLATSSDGELSNKEEHNSTMVMDKVGNNGSVIDIDGVADVSMENAIPSQIEPIGVPAGEEIFQGNVPTETTKSAIQSGANPDPNPTSSELELGEKQSDRNEEKGRMEGHGDSVTPSIQLEETAEGSNIAAAEVEAGKAAPDVVIDMESEAPSEPAVSESAENVAAPPASREVAEVEVGKAAPDVAVDMETEVPSEPALSENAENVAAAGGNKEMGVDVAAPIDGGVEPVIAATGTTAENDKIDITAEKEVKSAGVEPVAGTEIFVEKTSNLADVTNGGAASSGSNVGVEEGGATSIMDIDTNADVASPGADMGVKEVPQSMGTAETARSTLSDSLPKTNSGTISQGKRGSPDEVPDQPPLKKAKGDSVSPSSVVGALVSSQEVAPEVPAPTISDVQPAREALPKPMRADAAPSASINGPSAAQPATNAKQNFPPCDDFFASCVDLSKIPDVAPLPLLSYRDIAELESALQIGDKYNHTEDNAWRDDWSGNLQLIDKELLMNRGQIAKDPQTKPVLLPFIDWVAKTAKGPDNFRGVRLLFSYVYHMKGTPPMAQEIMAYSLQRPAKTIDARLKFIVDGMRRISYDPTVLNQDGWTTQKADSPDGVSGGAFLIGRRVIWHRYEAIVIAFVRDEEIGDLWKAIWLEDHDTFDLEADELQDALKKWERKEQQRQKKMSNRQTLLGGTVKPLGSGNGRGRVQPTSMRFAAQSNFTVDGIEHGIILATSFNQQARQGVPWPARVMHASEMKAMGAQSSSRRSSSKSNIHVVFLAPYWNGQYSFSARKSEPFNSKAATSMDPFSTGPLFEMDMIEVSESTVKKYEFDSNMDSLSIDRLRTNFRFLGLPKAAFPRFLDAHRLALAFKTYAQKEAAKSPSANNQSQAGAFAALTDTHTLSVRAHVFPQASLDLPFDFILSKLPCPVQQAAQLADETEETTEPVINIHSILKSMCPPRCFGIEKEATKAGASTQESNGSFTIESTPHSDRGLTPVNSPDPKFSSLTTSDSGEKKSDDHLWSVQNFASDYLLGLIGSGSGEEENSPKLPYLGKQFADLVAALRQEVESVESMSMEKRKEHLGAFLKQCLVIKGHGEDILFSNNAPNELNVRNVVLEWRKACERVYRRATVKSSLPGFGDGVTSVITDSRCNQHITASGSFERAVRLPAAIKGAKKAGAGSKESISLIYTVENRYMELAEDKILNKAHKASYLKRIKAKIASLPPDAKGMPLTDDSDGEGGEDTMGSRGSYVAAVLGVAAAIQGIDMIVGGQCVNVFCAIRPPGHHAGRELRPMNAISNGFCIFNAAACAALYATAPQREGGLGLKRVCVIDFDVHHGNGTQDILCSTHDPRFLYVSLHAGGAHINGYEENSESNDGHNSSGAGKNEGIFPGRCGDTSPHKGVLNIPLGSKVTAAAVGNALVTKVAPALEAFCPELIVLSAGFDAHKNDPLGMGGLSAEDFGSITEVVCQMAFKTCSGRVISVLEGGYGVPCCRPPTDLFLPDRFNSPANASKAMATPMKLLDLGDDLPDNMDDTVTPHLQQKLERCHQEGFIDCIEQHVSSLAKCNSGRK